MRYLIVVVDDEPKNLSAARDTFPIFATGAEVVTFTNGPDAISYLGAEYLESILLVIVDGRMPKMNGKETITEMLKRYPSLQGRVVGYSTEPDVEFKGVSFPTYLKGQAIIRLLRTLSVG